MRTSGIPALPASAAITRTMIDLHQVLPDDRLSMWSLAVPQLFPGVTLDRCHKVPNRGVIQYAKMANSHAWLIESSPTRVAYCPKAARSEGLQHISVMLQLQGSTQVSQGSRSASLMAGEFCFLDNRQAFMLEVPSHYSRFVAWQLPRDQVIRHHPQVDKLIEKSHDARGHAAGVVGKAIVEMLKASPYLKECQQAAALNSFVQLLGMLDFSGELPDKSPHWRLVRALGVIDDHLTNPSLNASFIADEVHVSRRQLDRMFLQELNMTVTARIWDRRLDHAAKQLKSPVHRLRSIIDIALSSGFEDAAHFTRTFKRHYKLTPREWRFRHAAGSGAQDKLGV